MYINVFKSCVCLFFWECFCVHELLFVPSAPISSSQNVSFMEKQTALSPGSETIWSLFFPSSFFPLKWRTYSTAKGTKKKTPLQLISFDYSISASWLQTGWLWIFSSRNEMTFSSLQMSTFELAGILKLSEDDVSSAWRLKEKEHFFHYSYYPFWTFILHTRVSSGPTGHKLKCDLWIKWYRRIHIFCFWSTHCLFVCKMSPKNPINLNLSSQVHLRADYSWLELYLFASQWYKSPT